jgi:hypothetical protein
MPASCTPAGPNRKTSLQAFRPEDFMLAEHIQPRQPCWRASQDEVLETGYVPSSRFQTPADPIPDRGVLGQVPDNDTPTSTPKGRMSQTGSHPPPPALSSRREWWRQTGSHQLRARRQWWSQTGSNRRPQACKASALPTELWPRRDTSSPAVAVRHGPEGSPR